MRRTRSHLAMTRAILSLAVCAVALLAGGAPAMAQNVAGAPSPVIKPGERAFGYRIAYGVADDGAPSSIAHRLHYDHAVTGNLRLRVAGTVRDRDGAAPDFANVAVEARWQVASRVTRGFDAGLIVNLAVPTSPGAPERLRFGLPVSVDIGEDWQVRAVAFTGVELGDNARDGALMETRFEATRRVGGLRVGAQMFSDYNTTAAPGGFDEQRHQLGFVAKGELLPRLKYETGALFGVSDAAADIDLRLFLSYGF